MGRRHAPRALLADEVGLGKTGVKRDDSASAKLLSGAAERSVIIVPETLPTPVAGRNAAPFIALRATFIR